MAPGTIVGVTASQMHQLTVLEAMGKGFEILNVHDLVVDASMMRMISISGIDSGVEGLLCYRSPSLVLFCCAGF